MTPHIPEDIDDIMRAAIPAAQQAQAFAESDARRQRRFEDTAVRRLLKHFGLSSLATTLQRRCKERTGESQLFFNEFLAEHPSFPVQFYFKKIPYLHQITQVDLFRRFSTLSFFKVFEEVHERSDGSRAVALVFDWPAPEVAQKAQGLGMTVIHNVVLAQDCPHTRFSRRFMTDPPQTVHVMRYGDFLEGLTWTPG